MYNSIYIYELVCIDEWLCISTLLRWTHKTRGTHNTDQSTTFISISELSIRKYQYRSRVTRLNTGIVIPAKSQNMFMVEHFAVLTTGILGLRTIYLLTDIGAKISVRKWGTRPPVHRSIRYTSDQCVLHFTCWFAEKCWIMIAENSFYF